VRPRIITVVLVLGALLLAARHLDLATVLNPPQVEQLLLASGALAPLAFMLLMAAAVIAPLPSFPLDVAAGLYFGPLLGTLYAATGATLGATMSFTIARWLGRDLVERFVGGHISFCTICSDRLLTQLVFSARLVPFVSFKVVSFGAGLTKMSVRRFAIATFLGMLPLTFAYVSAGQLLIAPGPLPITAAVVVAAALLALPMAVERCDIFGLRARFRHEILDAGAGLATERGKPPADAGEQ
jgi:uncharacterized membrane protein YdjX (TVP38/TMEM64 family)